MFIKNAIHISLLLLISSNQAAPVNREVDVARRASKELLVSRQFDDFFGDGGATGDFGFDTGIDDSFDSGFGGEDSGFNDFEDGFDTGNGNSGLSDFNENDASSGLESTFGTDDTGFDAFGGEVVDSSFGNESNFDDGFSQVAEDDTNQGTESDSEGSSGSSELPKVPGIIVVTPTPRPRPTCTPSDDTECA